MKVSYDLSWREKLESFRKNSCDSIGEFSKISFFLRQISIASSSSDCFFSRERENRRVEAQAS